MRSDTFGNSLIDLWTAEGINTSTVRQVSDAHIGAYFVTHGTNDREFTYFRAVSSSSRMGPDDLPVTALRSVKVLHVSGISQAISNTAADAVSGSVSVRGCSDKAPGAPIAKTRVSGWRSPHVPCRAIELVA
ncbi:PfkB family carbohydrate kinase [Ruegeria sp. HKCCD7319]|uniref:PfkB family carbohydrate kinase n=1 Tax=unclassified Ruegeria TaxID=2625375 RepID=UPI00352FF4D4